MNESIVAIPPNVEDPQVLKRFLQRLVEELDLVLGFRGNDSLVRQSELNTAAGNLEQAAATTLAGVAEALAELTEVVATITEAAEDEGTSIDDQLLAITNRLDDLELWRTAAQAELDNHELRITALETP